MLQLQRASAGSGKTYLLAKKFIWYFITVESDGKRRLRRPVEMTDSLNHILAITFTNKATAEMKHRIIDKLAAIATFKPGQNGKRPDYLDDFIKESGGTAEKIIELAATGLSVLLNSFSDFNVSTIDSFFQGVLRTFAYEAELNDSYEVELDGSYLASVSIDGLLEEIGKKNPDSAALYWVELLIRRSSGAAWNIFTRNPGDNNNTLYGKMLGMASRLDNEEYKRIRREMEEYFEAQPDLRKLYSDLDRRYKDAMEVPLKNLHDAASQYAAQWKAAGLDVEQQGVRYLHSHIEKCRNFKWHADMSASDVRKQLGFSKIDTSKKMSKGKLKFDAPVEETLKDGCIRMYEAVDAFADAFNSPEWLHWRLYRDRFPYLSLLKLLRDKRSEFLESNNLVELSETNSMLGEIIGDDDVPFVYERLGTRLHHFLIDEFQDTSRMQWENLSKLVDESESHGYSNLIIGDAKQSIYRFRNADSSLITDVVPSSYRTIQIGGMSEKENANWRSRRQIVEFNNFVFERMARRLTKADAMDYASLYANVCQKPMSKEDGGYVEFRLYDYVSSSDIMAAETTRIVTELISRGCRQCDIAVLVSTQAQAQAVILKFVEHNQTKDRDQPLINFIGEQTLRISSSKSVAMILSALGSLAEGRKPEFRQGEERRRRGAADWSDVKCNFRFFASRHPEWNVARQVEEFLKAEAADDVLNMMVADMHSVALPALIEAITEAFVPYAYREAEAQFISSFQDVVLDYCSRYPADVCSFLQWWGKNGSALSISVPEDIDAVQVMTIHKSKGLEFKYVVLPEVSQEFGKVPSEWHWVEPASLPVPDGMSLPPYMPVSADDAELADSVHSDIVSHSRDLSDMDIINRLYVAFTRAVDELYILSMRPKRASDGNVGLWLEDFLTAGYSSDGFSQKEPDYSVLSTDSGVVYTIGGRDSEERILSSAGQSDDNEMLITEYYVNGGREMLHYKAEDAPTQSEDAEEEENDPRSEGTLLHEVMAHVETASDLDSSLTASRMKGLLTRSQADEFRNILAPAMDMPEVKGWFDGTKRICNERSILNRFSGNLRPDRLMIDDDGNLIIVDYKFGSSLSHSKYVKQVSRYVRMMKKSGNFTSVKGYLWYVREGRVVPV